ncbi:hypothetical protein ES705_00639 [subsurface metagenome]|nr:hypothetical protein [Clostridia bacterium]
MEKNLKKALKLTSFIAEYKRDIKKIKSEAAISMRFSILLDKLFSDSNPKFIEEYLESIEKVVKMKKRDLIFRGRLDAFFGNVIIEFKSDILKFKEEAKRQQKKYLSILLHEEKTEKVNYLSLITDGVLFFLYIPKVINHGSDLREENIELQIIDEINIFETEDIELYYFLDRYLFREIERIPSVSEFVKDFGINSPAFNFTFNELKEIWEKIKDEDPFRVIFNNWDSYLSVVYGNKTGDYQLFLKHTYLSILVKILVSLSLIDKAKSLDLYKILKGDFFKEIGIINFLEEDFFSWITNTKTYKKLINTLRKIQNHLNTFNLRKFIKDDVGEDILKELYQELVDPETRHELGEYYTPDWLAEKIVKEIITRDPNQSFLDPSSGSGTFLYFIIKYKIKYLKNEENLLDSILNSVSGIDVHPLAVIISKTNYILALGELLIKRNKSISIPVYLSDSIVLSKLNEQKQLSIGEKVESLSIELLDKKAFIPNEIMEDNETYDEIIELIRDFAINYKERDISIEIFRKYVNNYFIKKVIETNTIKTLYSIADAVKELIEEDRDTIWIYILKNLYKPYFLHNKFDVVIGNPPWLSYRFVESADYQETLKEMIAEKYKLCSKKAQLITQLELGTLFFIRCADNYLKSTGIISFILPRSIFSSDQHYSFREGSFLFDLRFTKIWDLEEVKPLFNAPSCVVFGDLTKKTKYPINVLNIKGKIPDKNISLDKTKKYLEEQEKEIFLIKSENTNFWSYEKVGEIFNKASFYRNFFNQGASIVPRSFWFIKTKKEENIYGINENLPFVETPEEIIKSSKVNYSGVKINGNIEKSFIYQTLLARDLVPFGNLAPRLIILPIRERNNFETLIFESADEIRNSGYIHLANWVNKVEEIWIKIRSKKQEKYTAIDWLNYRSKLTEQKISKFKVVYITSGSNICGTVIPIDDLDIKIKKKNFIVDTKTYYFDTDSWEEASYLASFLNSEYINKIIKPMQSKGLFGPRDIHKKIWEINIPKYDQSNKLHNYLTELSKISFKKVSDFINSNTQDDEININKLRKDIKNILKKEIQEIDKIIKKLLI